MEAAKSSRNDLQALAGLSGHTLLPLLPRPKTMRALELRAYDGVSLVFVSNRPVPTPGPGEVLIKVHAAPVTPSDLLFLHGRYGSNRPLPTVPGLECSGLVIGCGGGLLARAMVGRRVSCCAPPSGDGTWAEYVCVPARYCVPLRSFISYEEGATLLSSTIGAWALIDRARQRGARAIAHTAGDSPLGCMLTRLAARHRLPTLHIIERPEQAQVLRTLGATHIIDAGAEYVSQQLSALFSALDVSVVIDASAGENTDALLRALPRGGSLIVCGSRPDADCTIDPAELICNHKTIEGFHLTDWLKQVGFTKAVQAALTSQRLLRGGIPEEWTARLPLEGYHQALELLFRGRKSGGQVVFNLARPN